jgi:type I restriction enzyme, S subunit
MKANGLPDGWRHVKIGEVAEIRTGRTPSRTDPRNFGGNIPWVKTGEVTDDIIERTEEHISELGKQSSRSEVFPAGSILIALYGQGQTRGRTAWLGIPAATNQACAVILPTTKADQQYLWWWLRSSYVPLRELGRGGNQPNLNLDIVRNFGIPLPPLSEQHHISTILDKADAIRRKREVGLRLTGELLRSTFLELFGDPVTNPREWPQQPLGELLSSIENGWSPKCHDRSVEGDEWGVLKLGSVTYCKYRPSENKALPFTERHHPEIEVKQGDLLLTRKNTYELVAACAYVFDTPPNLMLPDLIFRLRIKNKESVLPEFLWGLLTHPGKRKGIQALAGGSAGSMPNISKAKLLGHLIEVPPIQEQRRFADIMHRIHQIEKKRTAQQVEQDGLFNTLVQRAFRGEL